jgi:hypothetical protein
MDEHTTFEAPRSDATITVRSASGLVSCAPYLVGFTPHESLVLIFLTSAPQRRVAVTLRVDLVEDSSVAADREAVVDHLCASLARAQHFGVDLDQVHVLVYSEAASELPGAQFLAAVTAICHSRGVDVGEVLATDGERMWFYDDPSDWRGSDLGTPLHRQEALGIEFDMVTAGVGFVTNREALSKALECDPQRCVTPGRIASARRERDLAWKSDSGAQHWRRAAEDSLSAAFCGPYAAAEAFRQAPHWALALADARVREPVMYRLLIETPLVERADRLAQARGWLVSLVAMLGGAEVAPVAATLAAVVWQQGDGAFASIAAEHALRADPRNRLGALIWAACGSGMPPATWADVLATFSLAGLRASRPVELAG